MPRSFIKAKWVGTLMRDSPTLTYFINYHYSTNATFLCKIQQRLKPKTNLLGSWLHIDNSFSQSHRLNFFFFWCHILRSIYLFHTISIHREESVFFFFFFYEMIYDPRKHLYVFLITWFIWYLLKKNRCLNGSSN